MAQQLIVYPHYLIVDNNEVTSNLIINQDYHYDSVKSQLILKNEQKIHLIIKDSNVVVEILQGHKIEIFKEFYNCQITFNIYGDLHVNALIIPQVVSKNDIIFNLLSFQSHLNVYDSTLVNLKHRYDETVVINHCHQSTFSDYRFYGIAKDDSFLGIKVTSVIKEQMARSEAHQKIFIIISDRAKTSAHPNLVIDNYDVKASHANSIGRISQDQLYYLNSRGINKSDAAKLIIMGYFNPVLNTFDDDVRTKIEALINLS